MTSRRLSFLIAAALAAPPACTHHRTLAVRSVEDLRAVDVGDVVLEMRDGRTVRGRMMSGGGTTLVFQTPTELIPRRIETADIRTITVARSARGAVEGAALLGGVGLLAGALVGALSAAKDEECEGACSRMETTIGGALIGGVAGGVVGAAVGYGSGSKDEYELRSAPPR